MGEVCPKCGSVCDWDTFGDLMYGGRERMLCFDIDGTLCPVPDDPRMFTDPRHLMSLPPFEERVEVVRRKKREG